MAGEFREEDLRVDVIDHSTPLRYACQVFITHLPTGIEANASVPPCRSQIDAKERCLAKLRERVG